MLYLQLVESGVSTMDTWDTKCILCEHDLGHGEIRDVKSKGIQSFINASIKRNDSKHSIFQTLDSIRVHGTCAKSYPSPNRTLHRPRKLSPKASVPNEAPSLKVESFDFENKCALCDEDLGDDAVKTLKLYAIKTLIRASMKKGDSKCKLLKSRKSLKVHESCAKTYPAPDPTLQIPTKLSPRASRNSYQASSSSKTRSTKPIPSDDENKCLLCDEDLGDGTIENVNSKGIKGLVKASIKKKDSKHLVLKSKDSIKVHETCARDYPPKSRVVNTSQTSPSESTPNEPSSTTIVHSDLENKCLICTGKLRANDTRNVRTNGLQTFIKASLLRKDSKHLVLQNLKSLRVHETCAKNYSSLSHVKSAGCIVARKHSASVKRLWTSSNHKKRVNVKEDASDDVNASTSKIIKRISTVIFAPGQKERQFSLKEILADCPIDEWPSLRTLERNLHAILGNDIVVHPSRDGPVISFLNFGRELLTDNWNAKRSKTNNPREERKRKVRTASKIILEDIQSRVYRTNAHPDPDCFLENVEADIPETLRIFLDEIVAKGGGGEKFDAKAAGIGHAILTAAKQESFLSPLQTGLAAVLRKKFSSEELLRILHALGYSASYEEAVEFEACASSGGFDYEAAFVEFVLNNPCHNENGSERKSSSSSGGSGGEKVKKNGVNDNLRVSDSEDGCTSSKKPKRGRK